MHQDSRTADQKDPDIVGEFLVDKILRTKIRKNQRYYLIKWKGYPDSENTWEPEKHLINARDVLKRFEVMLFKTREAEQPKNSTPPKKDKSSKRRGIFEEDEPKTIKKVNPNNDLARSETVEVFSAAPLPDLRVTRSKSDMSAEAKSTSTNKEDESKTQRGKVSEVKSDKTQKEKNLKRNSVGSFKHRDKPKAIIGIRAEDDHAFSFVVEWNERDDGFKPENSHVSSMEFRVHDPGFLLRFYEGKLTMFSRKQSQIRYNRMLQNEPQSKSLDCFASN